MAAKEPPAWPFLMGALVCLVVGFVWAFRPGGVAFGLIVIALGVVLACVAVRQGRRSLAAIEAGEVLEVPVASVTSATKEKSVGDYTDAAAVRAIEKPKRVCKECGSPLLVTAVECPTCSTPV